MHQKNDKRFFLMMNGFFNWNFFCMAILTLIFVESKAQVSNESLENGFSFNESKIKKVQFRFNSLIYVKNNEYFNEIADGYTLFGYYLNPKISYQPHEKVQIELGAFAQKEFGSKGFKELQPTFTIQIKQNDWKFLFGNIEGTVNHRMIEPLMGFEKLLSNPLEHGIQVKYQKQVSAKQIGRATGAKETYNDDEVFFDSWIDWQGSTSPGRTNQEYIWAGANFYSRAVEIKGLKFKALTQLSVYHQGGQNIQSLLAVRTLINPGLGIRVQKDFSNNQSLIADNYYVGYFESPYRGTAYYLNTYWKHPKYQVGLSYWFSHYFTSPMGNHLFQSQSQKYNNYDHYEPYRSILIFRLVRDWKVIDGLNISLRFEPHYDVQNGIFEHSEGVYLNYKFN